MLACSHPGLIKDQRDRGLKESQRDKRRIFNGLLVNGKVKSKERYAVSSIRRVKVSSSRKELIF